MQKLHLVGFTKDLDGLIFSLRKGSKSGSFLVPLDDQLRSSLEEAQRLREGGAAEGEGGPERAPAAKAASVRTPKPASQLSPREIQARLRAGSTVAEVAAQAGVDEEWVQRFAVPIFAEQARVVERAQRLTFAKSRLGPSSEPLAASVQVNLADRGVRVSDDVFGDSWSAYNLHGTRWAVRFSYTSRQRRQVAEWEVDLREGALSARNRLASDLGHVEGGRRRQTEPAEVQAPEAPGAGGRPGTGPAKRAAPPATPSPPGKKSPRRAEPPPKPAKSASTAKPGKTRRGVTPGKVPGAARKAAGRKASPRSSRPAKKPPGDTPPGRPPAPASPSDERPTHLARPPSPMNRANRANVLPGRPGSARAVPLRPGAPRRTPAAPASTGARPPGAPADSAAPADTAPQPPPPADVPPAPPPADAGPPADTAPPPPPAPADAASARPSRAEGSPRPAPPASPASPPPPAVRILSTPPPPAEAPPGPADGGHGEQEGGEAPPPPPTRRPTPTVRVRRTAPPSGSDDAGPAPPPASPPAARTRVRKGPGAGGRSAG